MYFEKDTKEIILTILQPNVGRGCCHLVELPLFLSRGKIRWAVVFRGRQL